MDKMQLLCKFIKKKDLKFKQCAHFIMEIFHLGTTGVVLLGYSQALWE